MTGNSDKAQSGQQHNGRAIKFQMAKKLSLRKIQQNH